VTRLVLLSFFFATSLLAQEPLTNYSTKADVDIPFLNLRLEAHELVVKSKSWNEHCDDTLNKIEGPCADVRDILAQQFNDFIDKARDYKSVDDIPCRMQVRQDLVQHWIAQFRYNSNCAGRSLTEEQATVCREESAKLDLQETALDKLMRDCTSPTL